MHSQQIYNLIQPFVQSGRILKRDLSSIKNGDFEVIYQDDKVVACCGIRKHKNAIELYCLAVDKNHQGFGLAKKLLQNIENKYKTNLIAMSKYQGEWFFTQGFTEIKWQDLPDTINYNHLRKPTIFKKTYAN